MPGGIRQDRVDSVDLASLPPQVPHLPLRRGAARAAPPAPDGPHLGRPRGREQLHRQQPGPGGRPAHRRATGRRSNGFRAWSCRRTASGSGSRCGWADRRRVPARHAPVPHGLRRRPAAPHHRRGPDAVADQGLTTSTATLEDRRPAGGRRLRSVRDRRARRPVGRRAGRPRPAAERDRAGRHAQRGLPHRRRARVHVRPPGQRLPGAGERSEPRRRPASSTSAGRSPRPAWSRRRRRSRPPRRGTASTTAPTTATR